MAGSIAARSTIVAAMSTASNAIKTGIFTLLVPAIVAVGVPQSMAAGERTSVSVPIILRFAGGLIFVLGVIGYF